jgi:hypothetical protein
MSETVWQDISTAPKDGSGIIVRLSSGRECYAEYWDGAEDGPEWSGWSLNMSQSFVDDTFVLDADAEIVGWHPLPEETLTASGPNHMREE